MKTTWGRSGLQVSRIAFGTWQLGGPGGTRDRRAHRRASRSGTHPGAVTGFLTHRGHNHIRSWTAVPGLDRCSVATSPKFPLVGRA